MKILGLAIIARGSIYNQIYANIVNIDPENITDAMFAPIDDAGLDYESVRLFLEKLLSDWNAFKINPDQVKDHQSKEDLLRCFDGDKFTCDSVVSVAADSESTEHVRLQQKLRSIYNSSNVAFIGYSAPPQDEVLNSILKGEFNLRLLVFKVVTNDAKADQQQPSPNIVDGPFTVYAFARVLNLFVMSDGTFQAVVQPISFKRMMATFYFLDGVAHQWKQLWPYGRNNQDEWIPDGYVIPRKPSGIFRLFEAVSNVFFADNPASSEMVLTQSCTEGLARIKWPQSAIIYSEENVDVVLGKHKKKLRHPTRRLITTSVTCLAQPTGEAVLVEFNKPYRDHQGSRASGAVLELSFNTTSQQVRVKFLSAK